MKIKIVSKSRVWNSEGKMDYLLNTIHENPKPHDVTPSYSIDKWFVPIDDCITLPEYQGFIYPTYDLSLEGYNLSPKSPAFKDDNQFNVGDLVEFHYSGEPRLGFVVELGSYHIDIQIAGSYEGNLYCASYGCIIKDSQLVKELTQHFKGKQNEKI